MNREQRNGDDHPPGLFSLRHDAWGRLVLIDANGREHVGVEPIRGFPLSNPRRGIALCDSTGRELLWIDNLDALPASLREVLEDEMARREFMPVVRRILRVSSFAGPAEWEVETDRGPTRFLLDGEDGLRRLGGHGVMLIDNGGVRYLIPDMRRLDGASRRLLDHFF
jgi:hypothetical protein